MTANTVTTKVILDSISPDGIRLPTLQLRYPRMVHADFLTHRVFTRNGRSSRAVPVKTLLTEAPYIPHFLMNQPGMMAVEEFPPEDLKEIQDRWEAEAVRTQEFVRWMAEKNVHKQWANRPLEWFGYIDVLLSTTDIANFMELRNEAGAQPEIQEIARSITEALDASTPKLLQPGEWHLPYIEQDDKSKVDQYLWEQDRLSRGIALDDFSVLTSVTVTKEERLEILKKVSVARCARLTIKPFDGNASIEKEVDRFEKLMVSRPVHASPAEHVATPSQYNKGPRLDDGSYAKGVWFNKDEWGNFYGWRQFRKTIPYNTIEDKR